MDMIVTSEALKNHLNIDFEPDEQMLETLILSAQSHIENLLGFAISERFGGENQKAIPASLVTAVLQLAAHWYLNREAVSIGATPYDIPMTVHDIVQEYRDWSW